MPLPLGPPCAGLLFNLAMQYGALGAKALQPISTWDQDLVDQMLDTLDGTNLACEEEIAEECLDTVMTLAVGLNAVKHEGKEAVPDKVRELLADIGKPLQNFIGCILNGYAMYGFVVDEGPVFPEEYPKGDWLYFAGLEPQRRKQVR